MKYVDSIIIKSLMYQNTCIRKGTATEISNLRTFCQTLIGTLKLLILGGQTANFYQLRDRLVHLNLSLRNAIIQIQILDFQELPLISFRLHVFFLCLNLLNCPSIKSQLWKMQNINISLMGKHISFGNRLLEKQKVLFQLICVILCFSFSKLCVFYPH